MSIMIICMLIAAYIPWLCAGLAKRGGCKLARCQGEGAVERLKAAERNSFEILPFFYASTLSCWLVSGGDVSGFMIFFVLLFVVARFAYVHFYCKDLSYFRRLSWAISVLAPTVLMLAALF